jgi:peptide/nickel transport system substrate-binding protein
MMVPAITLLVAFVLAWPAPGRAENVLRWQSAISGLTFDPHAFNHTPTSAQNIQVYEALVDFDSDHTITPGLAVAWRPIDSTTWKFELRQGVRFHDGTLFTAEDVVFSLRWALSPQSEFAQELQSIAAVEADGDHIVRVRTTGPNPVLPDQLFAIGIMSKAWTERHGAVEVAPYADAEIAYVEDHANGTGPFMLQDYEPGARMVLTRNADWWGLAKDAHNIDRVEFTAVADPEQRIAALLGGEIDFLHDPPFAELDRLASTPGVRLEQTMEFRTIFLGLNQGRRELHSSNVKGRNPFADLRVRQAIYQAIDIETIRNDIMRGYAIPAGMIIQPGINGYTPEFDTRPAHDPDAARSLLAEAGYPDGFEVRLDCPKNRYLNDEAICRAVAAMLAEVGIVVDLAIAPMGEHIAKLRERRTDFYMLGWGTSTIDTRHPFVYLYRSDGQYNATGYANPHVDELIDAIGTAPVTYARDALIEEVWRTVLADVVVVPLHHQVLVWALRDRLELPVDALDLPRFRLARFKSPAAASTR